MFCAICKPPGFYVMSCWSAFRLHKLIVCCLRKKQEKAIKDTETARGMLMFFEGKPHHIKRIREMYDSFPKGWKNGSTMV